MPGEGKFYVTVTNSIATKLTLYSDTITVSLALADTTTTVKQKISGTFTTDINNGIVKLLTVAPTAGADQLSGDITSIVTIDTGVLVSNSKPYVRRHYDLIPTVNAGTAKATVTLYFTQADFDNFNNYVKNNNLSIPLLPENKTDNGNVVITQFHGTFTGSSDPANYSGSIVFITPSVIWDNTNNWWAVSFPVTGFSGFYISTGNAILPLTLLQFSGIQKGETNYLHWLTADEINTEEFVIQRSGENSTFKNIDQVTAKSTIGNSDYSFTDFEPVAGINFYRLQMIDVNGRFTYSNIISLRKNNTALELSAYPNPAKNQTTLIFNTAASGKYTIQITDFSGKLIRQFKGFSSIGKNKVGIDLTNNTNGLYFIKLTDKFNETHTLKINKQ